MQRPYIDPSEVALLRSFQLPGSSSAVRASDAERERAAETLRRHHADGRLTTDEFEERTGRAYAAKTLGDLDQLFRDLPRLRPTEARSRPAFRGLTTPVLPLVALFAAIAVVAAVHLWFIWPLMFFLFFRFRLMRRGHWHSHGWPEPWRR